MSDVVGVSSRAAYRDTDFDRAVEVWSKASRDIRVAVGGPSGHWKHVREFSVLLPLEPNALLGDVYPQAPVAAYRRSAFDGEAQGEAPVGLRVDVDILPGNLGRAIVV